MNFFDKCKTYDGKIGQVVGLALLNSLVEWWEKDEPNVILVQLEFPNGDLGLYIDNQLKKVEE